LDPTLIIVCGVGIALNKAIYLRPNPNQVLTLKEVESYDFGLEESGPCVYFTQSF